MKKIGKKTIGVSLGFALVVGTMSFFLLANKNTNKVDAADPSGKKVYIKITKISDLSTGDKIILFNDTSNLGVTGNSGSDATTSDVEDDWKIFTVTMNEDGESFKASGLFLNKDTQIYETKYIKRPKGNVFTLTNPDDEASAAPCFPETINEVPGIFACKDSSTTPKTRYLVTNGQYNRCYLSVADYLPFKIYKVSTPADELASWCKTFCTALQGGTSPICKADGSTDREALVTAWGSQATAFGKLSAEAKELAKTASSTGDTDTAKAMKLYDYCVGKYTTTVLSNFIDRTVIQPVSPIVVPAPNNSILIIIVSIVSFVCISTVTCCLIVKHNKKKSKESEI